MHRRHLVSRPNAGGILLASLLSLVVSVASPAQDFRVIETSPTHGAANVPVEDEIVFQFNDDVDINTRWTEAFVVEPRAAIRIDRVFLGLDDQNQAAIVEFTVAHQANTDYVWLLYDVLNREGTVNVDPYVLRYSTAPDIGQRQVSGSVSAGAVSSHAAGAARPSVRELVAAIEEAGLSAGIDGRAERLSKHGAVANGHTLIYLLNHFAVRSADWHIRGATVIEEADEAYVVDYMRDGAYWPLAIKYADVAGNIEAVGFYDADGDFEPDSVVVTGSDREGIDLEMFAYSRSTAATYLENSREAAAEFAADQELISIRGRYGTTHTGSAYEWIYEFHSASSSLLTSIEADPLGLQVDTSAAPDIVAELLPISEPFIDSDEALQIAEDNGGGDFRAQFEAENVLTRIEAGNLFWELPDDAERTFWLVEYVGYAGGATDEFTVMVDMYSSIVLADEPATALPTTMRLIGNYPNPFSVATTVQFEVDTAADVRLSVFDLLGREVAVLTDGYRAAGSHSVTWDASEAPSGVYLCKINVGGRQQGRAMLLTR